MGIDAYRVSGRLVYRQKVRLTGAGREGIRVPVRTLDLGNLGSLSQNGVAQTEMVVGEAYDLRWGFDFSQSETAGPGQEGTIHGRLSKSLTYEIYEDQGEAGNVPIAPIYVNPYWIGKLSLESEAGMVLRPDAALPVPEPASVAVLGAGALGLMRRRRR